MAGGGIRINNIKVSGGANGKTATFKIEDGKLYNSFDGITWYELGTVKGADGKDGATGAKIVSMTRTGTDVNGGAVYQMFFDNGTLVEFTAPKGDKGEQGTQIYYMLSDSMFDTMPENIEDVTGMSSAIWIKKDYYQSRNPMDGDIVIVEADEPNTNGQTKAIGFIGDILDWNADKTQWLVSVVAFSFLQGEKGANGVQNVTNISPIYGNPEELPTPTNSGAVYVAYIEEGALPLGLYADRGTYWELKEQVKPSTLYCNLADNNLYRFTMAYPHFICVSVNKDYVDNAIIKVLNTEV
ncbi:MAG: hypothetical protein IKW45_06715 [Clostridia bacterium]|nr:hypothetical protein [Clostridia bacterium]